VLIAQAVFLLEHGQTDTQTNRRDLTPYSPGGYAGMSNKQKSPGVPDSGLNLTGIIKQLSK